MPSVAIHDMRVQPQRHDLLVATHGRGFWVLDDAGIIAGLNSAVTGGAPKLFTIPTAYTWYRWWTSYYGTHPDECCLTTGAFSGTNPRDGATITYYLPRAAGVNVEILDAAGSPVRCFAAPGSAGVQRTSWDLTVPPPVSWLRARDWNSGGSGATVIPGSYTV